MPIYCLNSFFEKLPRLDHEDSLQFEHDIQVLRKHFQIEDLDPWGVFEFPHD